MQKILKSGSKSQLSKLQCNYDIECNEMLSEFHFWFRYDRKKALKYKYRALKMLKKSKHPFPWVWEIFASWHQMEIVVQNYKECKRIIHVAVNWNVADDIKEKR